MHGVTKFMDLTPGEFAQYYTNYRPAARPEPENVVQVSVCEGAGGCYLSMSACGQDCVLCA